MAQWVPVSQLQGAVRTAASQGKGSGEQTGARGSSPSAVLPAIPIKPTSKSGPSTPPVAKPASAQHNVPGAVLPAIPIPVAAQASSTTAVPVAKPVSPWQNPAGAVLPAVPIRTPAAAPVANAMPVDSGTTFDIDSLAATSAPMPRHPIPKKKKTNPLIWVAIGVPAAFIVLGIIGAIVGGSSDRKGTEGTPENDGLGTNLTCNGGHLYYKPPVTETEAKAFAEWLAQEEFFKSSGNIFQIRKTGSVYEFRNYDASGSSNQEAAKSPKMITVYKDMCEAISRKVFKGDQVDVHLCDERMKTITVITGKSTNSDDILASSRSQPAKDYRSPPTNSLTADYFPLRPGMKLKYTIDMFVGETLPLRVETDTFHDGGNVSYESEQANVKWLQQPLRASVDHAVCL